MQMIKWEYINQLQKLQTKCGLKAANKLSKRHVRFHQQKMKTNLCVQTLSNSVAVALGVCNELQIPGFEDSKPTEEFLAVIDRYQFKNKNKPLTNPKLMVY